MSTAASLLQMLLSLGLVLGAIFGLAWLVRRTQSLTPRAAGDVAVLAAAQVGAKERVLLLNAGGTHVLIGVAPGSVRTLHVYAEPPQLAERPSPPAFAEALKKALGR
ncbi:MAG TPA: flagellar biosynthetic protein FliO [Nevskiaceae bacterium]|nr:flagellar biosynthetic protein FliO [Nevskiaceae bacterium]